MTERNYTAGEMRAMVAPLVNVEDFTDIIGTIVITAVRRPEGDCVCGNPDAHYALRMNTDLPDKDLACTLMIKMTGLLVMGETYDPDKER